MVFNQVTFYQPCCICETLISAQMYVMCCKEGRMSSKESKSYSKEKFFKKRESEHQNLTFTAKIQNLLDVKYVYKNKSRTQQDIQMFQTPNNICAKMLK